MFAIFFYHPHPLFLPEVFGFLFILHKPKVKNHTNKHNTKR
jgi:hypothetical protein